MKILGTAKLYPSRAIHLVDGSGKTLCNTRNKMGGLYDEAWNPDFKPERVDCMKCKRILETTLKHTMPK